MRKFIGELPRHYGRSPQDREIQRVLERMAARAETDLDFTLAQLFPSTASGWGLALWEEAYGLTRLPGQTEEQRRAVVLASLRARRTTTAEVLQDIAYTVTGLDSEVREYFSRYFFTVTVKNLPVEGAVNFRDLRDRIALLKPAHLDFYIIGAFPPIPLENAPGSFRFQRLRLSLRARSYGWDIILLDGAQRLDGGWTLDQQFRGMAWEQVDFALSIREENRLGGTLTRDTMWLLNAAHPLNGQKKLNAAIIREEI